MYRQNWLTVQVFIEYIFRTFILSEVKVCFMASCFRNKAVSIFGL